MYIDTSGLSVSVWVALRRGEDGKTFMDLGTTSLSPETSLQSAVDFDELHPELAEEYPVLIVKPFFIQEERNTFSLFNN